MKTKSSSIAAVLCFLTALTCAPTHAALPGMKIIKLTSRSTGSLVGRQFGAAVAASETHAVVGEPGYDLSSPKPGAVHVFNASTGAFIRTLKPADSIENDGFGSSVAIQGKYLLVGANRRMSSGKGAAYLFDVTTGKLLRKIEAFEPADFFGSTVAISGDLLFVSAPEAFNRRGKVLVQGLFDPTLNGVLKDDNANTFSYLGTSLYAHGNQVVVSSPGSGELYFFNRTTFKSTHLPSGISSNTPVGSAIVGTGHSILFSCPLNNVTFSSGGSIHGITFANPTSTVRKVDPAPAANRQLGRLMAMESATLVASADLGATGTSLIVHDVGTSNTMMVITPQDLGTKVQHSALTLTSNRLLIGSAGDGMLGVGAGAAYLVQTLPQAAGFVSIASKGDSAPGFASIHHNRLGEAAMSFHGLAVTRSTLTGTGSNGGKDIGMYSEVGHEGYLTSVVKTRQNYVGNLFFGRASSPISNHSTYSIFSCTLTGPGITKPNNSALFADATSGLTMVARTGTPLFGFTSITPSAIRQAAQSHNANRTAVRLDAKLVPDSTTLFNDSAVTLQTHAGVTAEVVRENDPIMGLKIGQIAPRVAFHSDAYYFSAALRDPNSASSKVGLFKKLPGGALTLEAQSDTSLPEVTAFKYTHFLGEGGSSANPCLRVIFKGPGITATNNEMILFNNGSGLATTFQKNGSIIGRILRVWPLGNRMLVHVTLKGQGISSSNNEALFLYQENGSFSRVLQKGFLLPGTGGARVGKIQRVEGSTRTGHYAVLVSLTNTSRTTNQMLLRGNVDLGSPAPADVDEFSLRRPLPVLQKGRIIANGSVGSTRLTSLAFASNATVDSTGIGGKGLASVVSATGAVLLNATFSDGSSRLIRVP